jgi:hypothetical protein
LAQIDHQSRINQHIRSFNEVIRNRETLKREVAALGEKKGGKDKNERE